MIKTKFCFPQLNAENQCLLPSHCINLQDIKGAGRTYQFRRQKKRERYGKTKSLWKPDRASVKFSNETHTASIQLFGHVMEDISLTAKIIAGSKYFRAKEMLNNMNVVNVNVKQYTPCLFPLSFLYR